MKRVLVFGVFDKFHPGHRFFLSEAKKLGDHLTVCLTRDEIVVSLKGHAPAQTLKERQKALESADIADEILIGDSELGNYTCLEKAHPDTIALGYDQETLRNDLSRWLKEKGSSIRLVTLSSHKPEIYKSSLL